MGDDQSRIIEEIRSNVAFEQFIGSILTGAALGGVLFFSIHLTLGFIHKYAIGALLLSVTLQTMLLTFLIFLIGFFTGVFVINPLFKVLERAKRRTVWPYLAAVMGVVLFSLTVLSQLSQVVAPGNLLVAIVVASGLVIAFDFGRRMRPVWKKTTNAEQHQNEHITRLH